MYVECSSLSLSWSSLLTFLFGVALPVSCPHCPKKFSRRHDRARHCSPLHNSSVVRDGNVTVGGRNTSSSSSVSTRSESDDEEGDYDDSLDEDKNFQLVDYAG